MLWARTPEAREAREARRVKVEMACIFGCCVGRMGLGVLDS